MESMPLNVVILGAIPEAILILWAGLHLMGVRPPIKRLILVGVLQGISGYFVRRYFDFGLHVFLQSAILILYTYYIIRVKWVTAAFAVIISTAVIILIEGSLFIFTNTNMAYLLSMDWMRILFLLPHEVILGLIGYICRKENISLLQEFRFLEKITK